MPEKRPALKNLVGVNMDKPPIHVRHADLKRDSPNSQYKSECPACKYGVLLMGRDDDMRLMALDYCILCGQKFVYDDIAGIK